MKCTNSFLLAKRCVKVLPIVEAARTKQYSSLTMIAKISLFRFGMALIPEIDFLIFEFGSCLSSSFSSFFIARFSVRIAGAAARD